MAIDHPDVSDKPDELRPRRTASAQHSTSPPARPLVDPRPRRPGDDERDAATYGFGDQELPSVDEIRAKKAGDG